MILGFTKDATRTKVAYNTAAQLFSKFLSTGTTFIVSFFLARTYGANSFGDFIKITTFVGLFFLATDFGLNAQWLQQKTSWTTLVTTRLILSILFSILAVFVLSFFPTGVSMGYTQGVRMGIYIFLPAIFFQSILTSANAVFQKTLRYDLSTIALAAGVVVVLTTFLTLPAWGVTGSFLGVIAILGGIMTTAIVSALFAARMSPPAGRRIIMPADSVDLFVLSIPLGLTLLFNVVYAHVDSVILASTRSTAEVGFYGFAYKIFEFALAVPTFFMNAVYPLLLKAKADRGRLVVISKKSITVLVASSIVMVAVLWLASPLLSVVRPEFSASIPALRVLSLGLPIFFVSSFVMWALIAAGRQRMLVYVYAAAMVINIILNLRFVPAVGYMAAAWITVASEAMVLAATGTLLVRVSQKNNSAIL